MDEPKSQDDSRSSRSRGAPRWLPWVALVGLVAVAYSQVGRLGFIWDDDAHLTANPCIVGPEGFRDIWTSSHARICPLVITSFWVQHTLWGLNPLGPAGGRPRRALRRPGLFGAGLGGPIEDEFRASATPPTRSAGRAARRGPRPADPLLGRRDGRPRRAALPRPQTALLPATVQQPRPPVWIAGYWPNRRPMRRAAEWDGAVPLFKSALHGQAPPPEEVRDLAGYIAGLRGDRAEDPFDIVVGGVSDFSSPPTYGPLQDAGATCGQRQVQSDPDHYRAEPVLRRIEADRRALTLAGEGHAELGADVVEHLHDPQRLVQRQQVGLGAAGGQQPGELGRLVGEPVLAVRRLVAVDLPVVRVDQAHRVRAGRTSRRVSRRAASPETEAAHGVLASIVDDRVPIAPFGADDRDRLARVDPGRGERAGGLDGGEPAEGQVRERDRVDRQVEQRTAGEGGSARRCGPSGIQRWPWSASTV